MGAGRLEILMPRAQHGITCFSEIHAPPLSKLTHGLATLCGVAIINAATHLRRFWTIRSLHGCPGAIDARFDVLNTSTPPSRAVSMRSSSALAIVESP